MPDFIPGTILSHRFYWEAVRPILDAYFPQLPHAAAHIGDGSDVLGFDTEMSTDHDWGPSVMLFLPDEQAHLAENIREVMRHNLPHIFCGYPTNFGDSPAEPGSPVMHLTKEGPINHHVLVTTVRAFALRHLAYDVDQPLDVADWLTLSSQKLLEVTAGAVHYDGVGGLTALRERLAYYPHDVWLYLLAAGWQRIGQDEHLMPRAGYAGDELGSAIICSRLVRDVMSLCFLMEKQYAPYPKWFGTAFKRLKSGADIEPVLWSAQVAQTWQERNAALSQAYEYIARMHNTLSITERMPEAVSQFFGRPFMVIWGHKFADAIRAQITDPSVRRIASCHLLGSVDQFSDSTDLRSHISLRASLRSLYEDL